MNEDKPDEDEDEQLLQCEECGTTGIVTKHAVAFKYQDVCPVCWGHGYKADDKLYSYKTSADLIVGRVFVDGKGTRFPCFDMYGEKATQCPICGTPITPVSFRFGIICPECKRQVH